jgi:hypothetical protein
MDIKDLIQDWAGFEHFVAELNKDGKAAVEHNVVLRGKSGAPRQIDVLITHAQGLYQHKIIAECKHWKKNVTRQHVDALVRTVQEVSASGGVIFSTKGFQSGAIEQAKSDNIQLFTVRELTDDEWGLPGKVVDFYLQVATLSVNDIEFPDHRIAIWPLIGTIDINLNFDDPTLHTTVTSNGATSTTLEEAIEKAAMQAARGIYSAPGPIIVDGKDATIMARQTVNANFEPELTARISGNIVTFPKAKFELGLTVTQSRTVVDRARNMAFAVALQDYVKQTVTAASRMVGEEATTFTPIERREQLPNDKPIENGSVMTLWMGGTWSFEPFVDMPPNTIKVVPPKSTD